jgi:ABC-type transport system involved in Fe-S cluster assembly fused permease/ATPase subunit
LSYGHIVERGTHDNLIQIDGGFYSRLIAQH